jgi:hypothetical protein
MRPELLQGAQDRKPSASNARIDRSVGLVGELELDQPAEIGGEAGFAFGGSVRLGLEGGCHAVQAELGELAVAA